jgi:hypothetical protein
MKFDVGEAVAVGGEVVLARSRGRDEEEME